MWEIRPTRYSGLLSQLGMPSFSAVWRASAICSSIVGGVSGSSRSKRTTYVCRIHERYDALREIAKSALHDQEPHREFGYWVRLTGAHPGYEHGGPRGAGTRDPFPWFPSALLPRFLVFRFPARSVRAVPPAFLRRMCAPHRIETTRLFAKLLTCQLFVPGTSVHRSTASS